ncbi:uncharacterized protein MELLADRAFT_69605 [Melampsora larici-populina 98AG31]|uniref:Uncharacterized protein n=1 Tax=Melampsora larici-populina (strain 98AG31 / pathotype 3-4-7) TaxID=747676 RepID=F4SBC7_MELLP|nr:uncharacterized protein MELLADRAFT_69605 [Melampsora larici-populina 98AG31]EGF98041.1 hypothetical protein MELLADRAFT_69605 [Melampsora larici-populina 98AG31]
MFKLITFDSLIDLYFSNSISNLENTPEAQPSLRTIRSLPQRRNKRPRLNHIESPPPPPESSSPTEASRSESPVTPPTRLLPFHSPRTKEAIATLTDSVAAFNIRRSSRKPMTSEIVRLASPLDLPDGSDHYSYGAPRLEIGSCLEEYENHQVGQLANGVDEEDEEDAEDAPEEDQQVEDEVDEADQDFSGYAFLSAGHPKQTSSTNQSSLADQPNANRKKRKVPSTVVIPLAHPVIQYGLEYELRPANVSSPYTLPHTMAHTTPAFGQLLRAAQLEGEGGEYDDAEEEEEDVSASTTPVDFTNPVTLAKALSSHHVKMMKKPISSPRHYGRQLHKLALSRLLIRSSPGPSSSSHLGSISTPDQSTKTPKKTKSPSLTARNNSASKRTPNRKTPLRPKPKAPLSKLKMPVLPNLYDPSLPLEVAYPTTVDPARLTKLRSHSNREQVEENHSPRFEVFPRPSSVDQSRRPSLTMPNHANESEDGSDGHSLRGEFSFRLEIAEINHRLVALHIAISDERKTREAQIKEAMKIAMEQQHDLRQHIRRSDTAKLSLGDAEGRSDQRSITVGKDSIKGETTPMKSSGLTSNNRRSKSHMSQRPLTSNVDHGPSGPPPSEPPPPLPSGPHTNSSSANLSLNNPNGRIPEPSPKKNGKKGKKKRSAHANANNIHHRDNYVPSRLPTTHQQTTTVAGQGVLGTELATMDLLAKDYDPTGTRSSLHPFIDPNLSVLREGDTETSPSANNGSHSQLGSSAIAKFFVEPDEWICGFCEYELWFGEELSLIKVIKNRKMILRRRKRAKERAARAAAGIKNPSNPGTGPTNSSGNNGLASSSSSGTNNNKNIVNPVHSNNPSIPPPPPPPPTSSPASP